VRGSSAGRYHWEAQDGEVHLTSLNPNAATIAEALEFCKLHDNRPTLEEWSAANGGEEAAVLKFCNEQASPPWALLHNLSQGVYRIVRDETGGYGKTDSSAAKTLAAACEAAKRPAPWGPGKEWTVPETVGDALHQLTGVLPIQVAISPDSVYRQILGFLQDECSAKHEREEDAHAAAS
jgi:hypothetical protein